MKAIGFYWGWLMLVLLGALQACAVAAGSSADADTEPKILFLTYSIEKDSAGRMEVRLTNQRIVEGSLKLAYPEPAFKSGNLKCVALDKKKQPLNSATIPNPLNPSFEYVDENGKMAWKDVQLNRAEFPVRMQMPAGTKFVAIERMDSIGSTTLLITEINHE